MKTDSIAFGGAYISITPNLMKRHIKENMILGKDNLAFGYSFVKETPVVIGINIEDYTEKIVFAVKENKELLWITTTLKNKDHKKAVKIAEENVEFLINGLEPWLLDEDSADLDAYELMKIIDDSVLVSDGIAFQLLVDDGRAYTKAIWLKKRIYYAKIVFFSHDVIETNMPKNALGVAIGGFKRNYKFLFRELTESFDNGNTTDTTEEN
ncbi:MAG: hypothetical protein IJZ36_00740 [Bacilli bacterium]|nr:hypothetical protein [Bacilli bacterium]